MSLRRHAQRTRRLPDSRGLHCSRCRFFVIGTNDLTQYTHAVSRELAIAEHYYRPASPAMKKLIAMVVDAARKADIPVTICGLAVGNAVNATQYLHLGLRSFSMSRRTC